MELTDKYEGENWYDPLMQCAYELDQTIVELQEEGKSGWEKSARRIEDEKEIKIKSLENELWRSLKKIQELEQKLDNEGEVISILNQPL